MQTCDHLPPFKYPPLSKARQEIRLLRLCAPSQKEDSSIVECSIQTASIDTNVEYLAVSYVWGASSPTQSLIINGDEPGEPRALQIGTNLNEALRYFQSQEEIRNSLLWIDAICISQKDDDEKSWQVASMKSIYEQAIEVLAWLGPSTDTDRKAFDMLENLENRLHETGPDLTEERFSEFAEVLAKDDGSGGRAIQEIIERPWFRRIWIQQEFLAARDIEFACGGYFCRWETLFVASATIKSLQRVAWAKAAGQALTLGGVELELFGLQAAGQGTDMFRLRCDFQGNNDIYSLWELLLAAKAGDIRSTDPRDTIFALIGLARDRSALGIEVDYKLTPQNCFVQASKALLQQGHLRLLWLSSQPKTIKDLPSWVPDWSAEWNLTPFVLSYCKRDIRWDLPGSNDGNFTAGSPCESSPRFKMVGPRELLIIRGVVHGGILSASAILGKYLDFHPLEYLLLAVELVKDMANGCTPPVNLDTQVVIRTLLHDTESKYDGHSLVTSLDDITLSVRLTSELLARLTDYIVNDHGTPDADLDNLFSYLTMSMSKLENRRIFLTSGGSLGIGSARIKPGDIVVVLQGAEVPFVIREDCSKCDAYNLISEAYVHGIMYGELMNGGPEAREFQIY